MFARWPEPSRGYPVDTLEAGDPAGCGRIYRPARVLPIFAIAALLAEVNNPNTRRRIS